MKRILASTCLASMLLVTSVGAIASDTLLNGNLDVNANAVAVTTYISFEDYIEKYGVSNILEGFAEAAAENRMEIAARSAPSYSTYNTSAIAAEAELDAAELFESLSEGEFLGLEVLGVTDVAPNDPRFMVHLNDENIPSSAHLIGAFEEDGASANSVNTVPTNYYNVYYQSTAPDENAISLSYEELAGSYFYKYSYAFDNNYLCTTNITFSNSQLVSGTQENNMYAYIAAVSSTSSIDFGFVANPSASNRNQGMYACYNPSNMVGMYTEGFPKVPGTLSNGVLTINDETVDVRLSIGTDTAEMYMAIDGECVFYKVYDIPGLVSGQANTPLTFLQAMSCVSSLEEDPVTSLTGGGKFTNVTFSNTKLYSFDSGERTFGFYGSATYYVFVCQPLKLNFSYGNNSETISINYN